MARSRTIKPDFFRHEDLASVSPLARLLFIGLWTVADRDGYIEERPGKWKMDILPGDNVDANDLLSELLGIGVVERTDLENEGRNVLLIPKFCKHQRIHPKESSLFEASNEPELSGTCSGQTHTSPPRAGARARKKKAEGKKEEKKKAEGRRQKGRRTIDPATTSWFLSDVWPHYPLKTGRQTAMEAASRVPEPDRAALVAGLKDQLTWPADATCGLNPNREKLPHASTWINQRRWEDERPAAKSPRAQPGNTRMIPGMTNFIETDWED